MSGPSIGAAATHEAAQGWEYGLLPAGPHLPPIHYLPSSEGNGLERAATPIENQNLRINPAVQFLEEVTFRNSHLLEHLESWDYVQRRQAQEIFSYLLVGPMSTAKDKAFLQEKEVTMLLAIRPPALARVLNGARLAAELDIEAKVVDVQGKHALLEACREAIRLINSHLRDVHERKMSSNAGKGVHGKILVYCDSGNELSAAVVAAYIIAMYRKSVLEAIQWITSRRFCCHFERDVQRSLSDFAEICEAQRMVARGRAEGEAQYVETLLLSSKPKEIADDMSRKRKIDDLDMDTEMGDVDMDLGEGSSTTRTGRAPFQNVDPWPEIPFTGRLAR